MNKLLLIALTSVALLGCDKKEATETDVATEEVVQEQASEEDVVEAEEQEGEQKPTGSNYQNYMALIDDFSKKDASPLSEGYYENVTLINKRPIEMKISIKDGSIKKSTKILDSNDTFESTANYEVIGSTLRYDNIKGNKFLFNPQGEAYVALDNGNFALVDICDLELSEKIPSASESSESDTFCKDNVLFTAYRIMDKKSVDEKESEEKSDQEASKSVGH